MGFNVNSIFNLFFEKNPILQPNNTNMTTSEEQWYPKGYFPLVVRVTDRKQNDEAPDVGCSMDYSLSAEDCLNRFVRKAQEKYDMRMKDGSKRLGAMVAEAVVAVPFPDRELIRIELNVFASEMDDICGEADRFEFYMQSDF